MPTQRMQNILALVDKMPPLPTTSSKVAEIANDSESSVADMDAVISKDPVIASKLLKLVNSAYYGLNQEITATSRAIGHLGMNNVKNIVLVEVVMKSMRDSITGNEHSEFVLGQFWEHSVGCSIAAKMLATKAGMPPRKIEEITLSAILHDIGKIILFNHAPDLFVETLEFARANNVSFIAAERRIYDPDIITQVRPGAPGEDLNIESKEVRIDHSYVGKCLSKKWKLPRVMDSVISWHHFPGNCPDKEYSGIVDLVFLADAFCKMSAPEYGFENFVPPIKDELMDRFGIDEHYFELMKEKWMAEVENVENVFEVLSN